MEKEHNLITIKNKEDLENYREILESTKSSLSILMLPYLMGKVDYNSILKTLKGEMVSLFRLMNHYIIHLGIDAFTLVYKKLMDKIYKEKISNMEELLLDGWYIEVNEIGGYTPRRYGEEKETI